MTEVLRGARSNAQFTLQPWDHDPHPWYPFTLPAKTPVITIVTDWYVPETAPVAIFAVFSGRLLA